MQRYVKVEVVVPEYGGVAVEALGSAQPQFEQVEPGTKKVLQITEDEHAKLFQIRGVVQYQEIERSVEIVDASGTHGLQFVYARTEPVEEAEAEEEAA